MLKRLQHRGWHYLLLLAAGSVSFLVHLGGASLWDLDEGRNATATGEMVASGNFVVPTFNSELRRDKPALLYWLQALAYKFLTMNEFSARLPSALAALVTMLLCYELGRSLFGKGTGFLAALIVGSTPMLCGAARFANPDALLHCAIVLTMLIFWVGHRQPGGWWFASLGLGTGLAMLAKGPVGLILPWTIMGLYGICTGQFRRFLRPSLAWGMLTFCLVALPWYIWVGAETKGEFLKGFLLRHNVERALNPMENHRGSAAYYPLVLILGTTPWSIFLGLVGWYGFWSILRQPSARWAAWWQSARDEGRTDAYRFLFVWIGVFVAFFSLAATKLPNYVLPVSVPLALLTARFLVRWCRGEVQPAWWTMGLSLSLLLLIGIGAGVGLLIAGGIWEVTWLRGRTFPGLEQGAILGIVPVVGALLGWWCLQAGQRTGLVWSVTLTTLGFVGPLVAWGNAALNSFKAPRPLVELTGTCQPHRDIRIGCWKLEHLPSLNFYVQRDVTHFRAEQEILAFLNYPIPVYLFLPVRDWEDLKSQVSLPCRELGRHRDLYRNLEIVVVTNR